MKCIPVKKDFREEVCLNDATYILKGCITGIVRRTPSRVDWHSPENSCPGEEDIDERSVRVELDCFEIDEDGNEHEISVPSSVLDYALDKFYQEYEEE